MNEETKNEETKNEEISDNTDIENKNVELEEKYNKLKNDYITVHADFENIKVRLEKEKFKAIEYANENFAKDLLSVLDSFDSALKNSALEGSVKEGMLLTYNLLLKQLEKHGITKIPNDIDFNPDFHNAVQTVHLEEYEDGAVVEVFQNGYLYNGRLLREALIIINKKD